MSAEQVKMVMDVIDATLRDPSKPWDKLFSWVETRTGVNRFRQLLIAVTGLSFLLLFDCGMIATVISNAIGFVYPAYTTIALMETPRKPASYAKSAVQATHKWLAYWPAFVVILIVEQHFGIILRFVPFYLLFKTLFLVWCIAPINNNGVATLYAELTPYLDLYFD
ncbi:TB2/DP1/HVA22-related protein [Cinara cedri]|uniref:Receptor expression-enhancing protein n=1 Tax=Cinara cedri TaxID=506608 RepID=A0A5E4NNI5_9HEMI|nr:TB2/DP1/HVA22-related protein [Cinara cedri]